MTNRTRSMFQIVSAIFAILAFYEMMVGECQLSIALGLLALWAQTWRVK